MNKLPEPEPIRSVALPDSGLRPGARTVQVRERGACGSPFRGEFYAVHAARPCDRRDRTGFAGARVSKWEHLGSGSGTVTG
jgi:hypothetical protein